MIKSGSSVGLKVVGSAGDDKKVKFLKEQLHFDAAFNYKKDKPKDALPKLCPEGIGTNPIPSRAISPSYLPKLSRLLVPPPPANLPLWPFVLPWTSLLFTHKLTCGKTSTLKTSAAKPSKQSSTTQTTSPESSPAA